MKTDSPIQTAPVLPAAARAFVFGLVLLATLASAGAADVNAQELAFFNLMKNAPGQHRPQLVLDPVLCKVARSRATDLAVRSYFAHVNPDGVAANYLVRQAGYTLPAGYSTSPRANEIESLAAGRETASQAFNALIGESAHRRHLLGEVPFYAAQTHIGIGYVNKPGSQYQWYWCIITAPPSGPQLAITSPKNGGTVNESFVTVSGTTGGNPAAASVQVRVENANGEGAWVNAEGTTSWTANVDGLVAGANAVRIQTLDASGAVLRETGRNIRYVVLAPVTIAISGEGSVTKGFAGTKQLEVGRSYTITATAKAGAIFAGWTGAEASLNRAITFTVPEGGVTLTANFIPNPFTAGKGGYTGLFTGTDGTRGAVNVSLSANGTFSAKARVNGESVVIKGRFDATGAAQVTATSLSGATYTLALNYTNGTTSISGTISGEGWSADLSLDALSKATTERNTNAGRYTLVIPAPTAAQDLPTGDSVAVVSVSSTGSTRFTGALADGTPFTVSGRVTKNGELDLFAPLYTGQGVLTGTLAFHSNDVNGTLHWTRPARDGAVFPSGFSFDSQATGSRYTAPALNQTVLPVSASQNNTELGLGDGGFTAPVLQPATLATSNTIVIGAPAVIGLTAKVNALNGTFSGKFIHPQTGEKTTFRGVILQAQGAGFGFFANSQEAGYATFAPATAP